MERATLTKVKNGATEGPSLSVSFNPKDLTLSKSNTWNPKKTPKDKTAARNFEFGSGGSASLKLQLVLRYVQKKKKKKKKRRRQRRTKGVS